MSRSATEVATLAAKAASGAGFPPAQADSFGAAAMRHLADGGESAPLLAALADPTDSPILRLPLIVEDILRALPLAGPEVSLTLQPGDEALAPAYAFALPLDIQSCEIVATESGSKLRITADAASPRRRPLPARIEVEDALIDALGALAAKTYVPASAASRAAGAGAGDIDND